MRPRALSQREARGVALVARRRDRLDAVARELGGPERALAIEADVTNERSARDAVERTAAAFGRIDTLVNNAGVMLLGPIAGADVSEWTRMVDLNLTALLHCTHAALPHLERAAASEPRRVADIVNISSVAGRVARANSGVYNATKFAVNAFSESLRQEVTRRHVRVSLVEPGAVSTELGSHNRPEIQKMMAERFGEMERLEADDIAEGIAFVVTRPRRMAINELLIRPCEQEA